MKGGTKGIGMRKHGKSGWRNGSGKSPSLRAYMKREAERNTRPDKSRIREPKDSVKDLFEPRRHQP